MGPWTYVQHLASTPRLPFTAAYFGSIGLTLYFSIGVSHDPLSPLPRYTGSSVVLTELSTAAQHDSHPVLGHHPDSLPPLVPHQLFPHGFEWAAPGHDVRR